MASKKKVPEPIVILHDGTFEGDSMFQASDKPGLGIFIYTGQTLKELKEEFKKQLVKEDWDGSEEIEINVALVKGAWVIPGEMRKALKYNGDMFGNDSAVYVYNEAMKGVASAIASKHIGKRAK